MAVTRESLRTRVRRLVCASGDNRFFTVGRGEIGHVSQLHVDTAFASGLTGPIRVQIADSFAPVGGSSGQVIRYQTQIMAGDVVDIPLDSDIQAFGGIDINVNYSGPIISLGMNF